MRIEFITPYIKHIFSYFVIITTCFEGEFFFCGSWIYTMILFIMYASTYRQNLLEKGIASKILCPTVRIGSAISQRNTQACGIRTHTLTDNIITFADYRLTIVFFFTSYNRQTTGIITWIQLFLKGRKSSNDFLPPWVRREGVLDSYRLKTTRSYSCLSSQGSSR